MMKRTTLHDALKGWSETDLGNLGAILECEISNPNIENIVDAFKWKYHSKSKAKGVTALRNITNIIAATGNSTEFRKVSYDNINGVPSYNRLLKEAAKHIKAYEGSPDMEECETFIAQAVIAAALHQMKPKQRLAFFDSKIDMQSLTKSAGIKSNDLSKPMTTFAVLAAAQTSGFGGYIASTTALGFLTNAIGITLPFAVYTGLSSTIAFVIGPVGWLTVGIWGAWKLMQPKWKTIIPALLYISSTNSYKKLQIERVYDTSTAETNNAHRR